MKISADEHSNYYAYQRLLIFAAVTCMYEDVLAKASYSIKSEFIISFSNGSTVATNKLPPVEYPFQTTVHYLCNPQFETVTKGSGQNISCGSVGRWRPQLAGCISN